jgi:maleamate amidohydrolase
LSDKSEISEETRKRYTEQGWGTHRIGFGKKPLVLIVDMQNDFVDPDSPSTCAPIAQERLPAVRTLLDAAREAGIPVAFSQGLVAADLSDVGLWKGKAHRTGGCQIEGTRGAAIIDELTPLPGEHVVTKRRPSVFFGTPLLELMRSLEIDTLLLAGSSMSGCVRATAVDAFSNDFRVSVIEDCVIDRSPELIERNLFDVNAKYCDAVRLDEVLDYLANVRTVSA